MIDTSSKFLPHCSMSSMRDLKLASLYFDKVSVEAPYYLMGAIEEGNDIEIVGIEFSNEDFLSHIPRNRDIEFLGHQTRILYAPDSDSQDSSDKLKGRLTILEPGSDELIKSIVAENIHLIFPSAKRDGDSVTIETGDGFVVSSEAESVYMEILRDVKFNSVFGAKLIFPDDEDAKKADLLIKYFSGQLGRLLLWFKSDSNVITNSSILSTMLWSYTKSSKFIESAREISNDPRLWPSVAQECLQMYLPDLSLASFDDIFEFKHRMHPELIAFRSYIHELQLSMSVSAGMDTKLTAMNIVNAKIIPAINDLSLKIRGIRMKSAASAIDQSKDPRSYAPLLGTVISDIPSYLAIATSLAMVAGKTSLDYLAELGPLRANGLYFLLRCRAGIN